MTEPSKTEANIIFYPVDKYEHFASGIDPSNITHYKGFASGLVSEKTSSSSSSSTSINTAYSEQLLSLVVNKNPSMIVWDGDNYSESSFTHLLPKLHQLLPQCKMVAFILFGHEDRFYNNWKLVEMAEITVFSFSSKNMNFIELGTKALQNTHSKHVVCLGGGKCVEEEFRNANKDVLFDVFPMNRIVVREKKDLLTKEKSLNDEKKQNDGIVTSIVEETSLLQFANEKNMNIYN